MSTAATTPDTTKDSALIRALKKLEAVGNKLPHPFWLFISLAVIILILSAVLEAMGVEAVSPADGETVAVVSLLNTEGLHRMMSEAVANFTSFPPLGLIIAVMLGVSVAEYSGLISAAIRAVVARVSKRWLTFVLALTGVTGSVASDAIYVVLIPLGAAAFKAVGRSPVLGAVVAFTSASAGYNASLLVTGTDAILAGLSTTSAQMIDPEYVVSPVANYFFSMASAVVLAGIVTLVAELVLTRTTKDMIDEDAEGGEGIEEFELDGAQRTALRAAGVAALVFLAAFFALLFVPGSPLQGAEGALDSPLLTDIVVPISLLFLVVGLTYGLVARTITTAGDIPSMMGKGLVSLTPVLVLFFAAAQFLAYFRWSNIGPIIAIKGADALDNANVPTLVLFAGLVLLTAGLNFFITSGSAQYALMAPVIVPMFMLLGYSPEVTQMLFRMGDSPTNIISPMSPYFALALGYIQMYYRKAGIGTLLAATIPVSMAMLVGWFLFFCVWYLIGLPLGPGVPVR